MLARAPITQPSANTGARFAFLVRRGNGWDAIEIGGPLFLGTVALALLLMLTAVAGTLYNLFRDDALMAMASGERREIRAYEDRIIELRQRIDRLTTKQIANQDTIEDRVSALVARQAELEARYLLVSDLEQRAAQAGCSHRALRRLPWQRPAPSARQPSPLSRRASPFPPRLAARWNRRAPRRWMIPSRPSRRVPSSRSRRRMRPPGHRASTT